MRVSLRKTYAAVSLAALFAVLVPATATGHEQDPGAAVAHHTGDSASAQSVAEYWTPERREAATPRDLGVVPNRDDSSTGASDPIDPTVLAEPTSPTESLPDAPPQTTDLAHATIGKVYFRIDGIDYECSAAVVSSTGRNMVFTAGHCLNDGNGGPWASALVFLPGFENDVAPHGVYAAETLVTTVGWGENGDFDYDFGIALLGQHEGYDVEQVVGSNGVVTGYSGTQNFIAAGYSAAGDYDGMTLQWCDAQARQSGGQYVMNCTNQTGGSSGGPWVENTSSTPYVSGVNSNADDRENPSVIRSPYFDSWVIDLYFEYDGH